MDWTPEKVVKIRHAILGKVSGPSLPPLRSMKSLFSKPFLLPFDFWFSFNILSSFWCWFQVSPPCFPSHLVFTTFNLVFYPYIYSWLVSPQHHCPFMLLSSWEQLTTYRQPLLRGHSGNSPSIELVVRRLQTHIFSFKILQSLQVIINNRFVSEHETRRKKEREWGSEWVRKRNEDVLLFLFAWQWLALQLGPRSIHQSV